MPRAEEALSTAYVEAVWDVSRSVVVWDLVCEGGVTKRGRLEGQLEEVYWEFVVGGIYPILPNPMYSLLDSEKGIDSYGEAFPNSGRIEPGS